MRGMNSKVGKKSIVDQYSEAVMKESKFDASSDIKLYQPYEWEQILLLDHASCLGVKAFLKMCGLKYTVEYRSNAEYMSPSGKVPFIKYGSYIIADLEPIVSLVSDKVKSLVDKLDTAQKSDLRAYMSLVLTVFANAENYITWCDDITYRTMTKPRYGVFQAFPLNYILTYMKRRTIVNKLNALKWTDYSLDKVYKEVDKCCRALSDRLGSSRYFFGDTYNELDAATFGHIYAIATWQGTEAGDGLADVIRSHPKLLAHAASIAPLLALPQEPLFKSALPSTISYPTKIDDLAYSDEEGDR